MIIYKITNKVNLKSYIGKTTKSLDQRYKRHFYNHKTLNTHLYKSMRKHGFENFCIEVLEETNINDIDNREMFWIKELSPHYNMTKGGDGGDTSSSPNYKMAMIEVHKKKTSKDYASYGMLGKKQSPKNLAAIKKANNCPVVCDAIEYQSVGDAQKAYVGINIRKRLDNPKYPSFYRTREKTKRGACRKE